MPSSLSSPSSQRELLVQPTDSSLTSKELEKLRRLLQQKCRIEIELCVGLSVLRLFRVGHVLQNRQSVLLLDWHNWFSRRDKE